MKRFFKILGLIVLALIIIYILGPKPSSPLISSKMPEAPNNLEVLIDSIRNSEAKLPLKENNQARIVWANDSVHKKTHYSVVYLHGFTASQMEGDPIHKEFAKRYGCNLFLSRLAFHGMKDSDAFEKITADTLYSTAKMALRIGTRIGDSVILMATSAGGAQALILAAQEQNLPIKALILYSPCIALFSPDAKILNKPWGLQLARIISHGKYLYGSHKDTASSHYWYNTFRIEGVIALQTLLDKTMNPEYFSKIHIPILCLAYYKNQKIQDSTVSVPAIRTMFSQLGTSSKDKEYHELPNVGDHVMVSYLRSKDLKSVREATYSFAEKHLFLKPVN